MTTQVIEEVRQEISTKCDRVIAFFVKDIVMNVIRINYYWIRLVLMVVAWSL